ncbi:MAG TPA: BON domain-containing protein, partial [Geobacteraceae bacterium]|nr:BON domain-containing protein [Geobacteraceae bacterium]
MKKNIFVAVLTVFGLALLSGCASIKGETTGEYIDYSTMTAKVNARIVKGPDAHYSKINVTTTQGDVVLQGFVNRREIENKDCGKDQE